MPYFEYMYVLQDDVTHASVCYVHYWSRVMHLIF